MPISKKIAFENEGRELKATLYTTANGLSVVDLPTVVIAAAWPNMTERTLLSYAVELSRLGFATFIFDHVNETQNAPSEISAEPGTSSRTDPNLEVSDIAAAVEFLKTLRELDHDKIGAFGVGKAAKTIQNAHTAGVFGTYCLLGTWQITPENTPVADALTHNGSSASQALIGAVEQSNQRYEQDNQIELVTVTGADITSVALEGLATDDVPEDADSIQVTVEAVAQFMRTGL